MEENQDVLIYFSLLEFRHRIPLSRSSERYRGSL
ncbi:hypothetical protein OZL92_17795 [Bacillus sonorensis]|nr:MULTISPECIES: hypothetical protein [Bacillus]MCY7859486.1 hypothetical protein [Bacillus sonorensis]MCY8026844.1 hypothetical protein [Bacillus sonorensis]MCY8403601.1 hypothetical protein [Bacillus sonorensis]MCZ0070591.1 hypothetical protein [Bacillus sonorensis]MCZ0075051.1 hypothetical protein [Bacillus sonorensis]